jgi:hypothetical protein
MSPEPVDQFTYTCDAEARIIRVVAQQTLTVDEAISIINRQVTEGRWRFGTLYDLRRVDAAMTKEDISRVAEYAGPIEVTNGPRGPVALVPSRKLIAPLAAFKIRARSAMQTEVFWDIDEAQKWLAERLRRTH